MFGACKLRTQADLSETNQQYREVYPLTVELYPPHRYLLVYSRPVLIIFGSHVQGSRLRPLRGRCNCCGFCDQLVPHLLDSKIMLSGESGWMRIGSREACAWR